ncbi:hypothetical protein L1857_17440 [Amycolatopsis thermalba]|uniref:ATP-binding protein n=1 Tax=Amycolatopsis thermalba TaxID=944492 RepID=A0ABY4NWN1_9PSEU|nr:MULTISPECIES: hypothetical protein [Amycolatopsis]UQS24476.1 hypothetical protein L1857_17440 [Amycolatopsis thermalba]
MTDSLEEQTPATAAVRLDGPEGLAPLRRRVRAMLADCPDPVVIDVVLLVDELAASACVTAFPPFEVRLSRTAGVLRVEVDGVGAPPEPGIGTGVLDTISTRWGTGPDGVLWAERELGAGLSRS